MMELSKPLQDEIFKIQNDLKAAIQNHQILVLRQKTNPVDIDIKKKLTDVQSHIRSLGESQKILVARVRSELAAKKSLRVNNNNINSENSDYAKVKTISHKDRSLLKSNTDLVNRSLLKHKPVDADKDRLLGLQKNGDHRNSNEQQQHNKDRSLLTQNVDYGRSLLKTKSERKEKRYSPSKVKEEFTLQDSSSEENKTPCSSPQNHHSESPRRSTVIESNWDLEEEALPAKRSKATLQATPRPSSPVQRYKSCKTSDSVSNSSEESVDNIFTEPYADSKENFMLSLGLISNEKMLEFQNKKSERKRRRRRRCSDQHHWYSSLWDLTVLQKRNHNKYSLETRLSPTNDMKMEDYENANRDDDSEESADKARVCFVCRKSGDIPLVNCSSCPTTFHTSCSLGLCPMCSRVESSNSEAVARCSKKTESNYTERLKEKQRLLKKNSSLKEELAQLEEKAKNLSVSLVNRVTSVNQLTANEEKVRNSIKKVIDFVTAMKKPELFARAAES